MTSKSITRFARISRPARGARQPSRPPAAWKPCSWRAQSQRPRTALLKPCSHRIRHEQWQSEERVDGLFNVAIVIALLLVVGSVIALTNIDAALGAAGSVWGMVANAGGQAVSAAAPVFLTYVAAIGLLMSALVMWWWADRRVSL